MSPAKRKKVETEIQLLLNEYVAARTIVEKKFIKEKLDKFLQETQYDLSQFQQRKL